MREGRARVSDPQADVITSEAKVTLAVGGIRAGKTHVGALTTIYRAVKHPTDFDSCHAITSPTFPMSKLGPEPKMHKLLADRRLFPVSPLVHYAKSERTWYIANEAGGISKVRLFTGEHPDRWRGDAWLSWWGDEAAMYDEYAYTVGLGRVAETDGPILFTTTPSGHNFLYRIAKRATIAAPARGYVRRVAEGGRVLLVSWSSLQNVYLRRTAAWQELVEQYDPDTYAQEVLAHFVARSGRVYKAFDRDVHVTEAASLRRGALVYVGQDFNVDRMCSTFVQDAARGEVQHVVDEMEIRDADTYQLCDRLDRWCSDNRVPKANVVVVPDASSRKRQTAGTDTARSDLQILINAGYTVRGARRNPLVKDRVNCVNGRFHHRKLMVNPRCRLLIEALESQTWDEQGREPVKDGIFDNRTDSLGYAVWYRYPLKGPSAVLDRSAA